jgi:hypothetical protein
VRDGMAELGARGIGGWGSSEGELELQAPAVMVEASKGKEEMAGSGMLKARRAASRRPALAYDAARQAAACLLVSRQWRHA